jgi:hypothetical protein
MHALARGTSTTLTSESAAALTTKSLTDSLKSPLAGVSVRGGRTDIYSFTRVVELLAEGHQGVDLDIDREIVVRDLLLRLCQARGNDL